MDDLISDTNKLTNTFQKLLNDINYYFKYYGGGSNSSASKLFDNLSNVYRDLGEELLAIQIAINNVT